MMNDYTHLTYHHLRARELQRKADEMREVQRRRREKNHERRLERQSYRRSLLAAVIKAHQAARDARRNVWDEYQVAWSREKRVPRSA